VDESVRQGPGGFPAGHAREIAAPCHKYTERRLGLRFRRWQAEAKSVCMVNDQPYVTDNPTTSWTLYFKEPYPDPVAAGECNFAGWTASWSTGSSRTAVMRVS
jgi:hypothetical protein